MHKQLSTTKRKFKRCHLGVPTNVEKRLINATKQKFKKLIILNKPEKKSSSPKTLENIEKAQASYFHSFEGRLKTIPLFSLSKSSFKRINKRNKSKGTISLPYDDELKPYPAKYSKNPIVRFIKHKSSKSLCRRLLTHI